MSVLNGGAKVVGSVGSGQTRHVRPYRHRRPFDAKRHQRVVMLTADEQHDSGRVRLDHVPLIYKVILGGCRLSSLPAGERGRYTIGGFSDVTFSIIEVLEAGLNANWPF